MTVLGRDSTAAAALSGSAAYLPPTSAIVFPADRSRSPLDGILRSLMVFRIRRPVTWYSTVLRCLRVRRVPADAVDFNGHVPVVFVGGAATRRRGVRILKTSVCSEFSIPVNRCRDVRLRCSFWFIISDMRGSLVITQQA